jgi:hypothetical protein
MKVPKAIRTKIKNEMLGHFRNLNTDMHVNLQLYNQVIKRGEKINVLEREVNIQRDTALVLADLSPYWNWAHPCQYCLHDAQTGELYETVDASFPPPQMRRKPANIEAFHNPINPINRPVRPIQPGSSNAPLLNVIANHPGERYAILYSGDSNYRHVNDIEFLYRTLIDVYGFTAANIHVLNHDGTINFDPEQGIPAPGGNWPGDNTAYRMIVNGAGTRAAMQATFATLAAQIQPEDLLFIHTNNHGAGPGDGVTDYCLCAYDATNDWVAYLVNDFIADLGVLPRFEVLMVMMEQCRSGGFINPIINNSPADWTHVATAVHANDYSQGAANFDPFAEDWIAAVAGQYPNGGALTQVVDTNGDGRISAAEAFDYADAVHNYDGRILRWDGTTALRLGDTPTEAETPAGYGDFIFLGLPEHDLYLRDNLDDHGREPLVDGGISSSPDIIVYNQALLDPEATLASPAAQDSNILGEKVEYGQDNFIYLRVHNRGTQATAGKAKVYWSLPSVLPTPNSWNFIKEINIPSVNPGEMEIVGPITWKKNDIPGKGHYCFVGLIQSGNDPAPDISTISTIDAFYRLIRDYNNATWKNFDVDDMFANSTNSIEFHIQGWPRVSLDADLMVDLSELPSNAEVTLRILKRLSGSATLEDMNMAEETQLYQKLNVKAGKCAYLRGMDLRPSDDVVASLYIVIPDSIPDGVFRIAVAQIVDGLEMGRVTRILAVGKHPFLANRNTMEVHDASCKWAKKVSWKNKKAYQEKERAFKHGYDGCHYCLPEFSVD